MRNLLTITRREVNAFFGSAIFWVLATAFMFFSGFLFYIVVVQPNAQADMLPLLQLYGTVLLFVAPLLAMRLLSEEQRSGTLELLMTSPVDDWQVVWGKWLGALSALVAILALTLFHVAIMLRLATEGMDLGPLAASYLGLVLLGGVLLAIGVLTSAMTRNQVVAAFVAIMIVLLLWFVPLATQGMGDDSLVSSVISYIGLSDHYFNFGEGLIDTRDVIYMVSLIVGALFLATRILESRRWR